MKKMKKLIYGGLFLATLGTGIVGCKKKLTSQNEINSAQNEIGILKKIDDFNEAYKLTDSQLKASTNYGKKLAADALGAVGASRWGTAIGGFPWGTGIGACIGAGVASYYAGIDLGDGSLDVYEAKILEYDVNVNIPNPNNNMYHNVGVRHNYILQQLLLKNPLYNAEVTTQSLLSNVVLTNDEREISTNLPLNFYTFFYGEKDHKEICEFLRIEFPNTQSEVIILERYFDVASKLVDFDEFMIYTENFEKLISEFSDEEIEIQVRATVLMSLAIAKHSGHFWYSVLN